MSALILVGCFLIIAASAGIAGYWIGRAVEASVALADSLDRLEDRLGGAS
jgi:hypothetical protein